MVRVDATVVGAGVIGLACACALVRPGRHVVVLEKEAGPGRHTSSRNSEVVHAGLYYPKDSLKARLCVRGARLLFEFCARHGIAHTRIGKVVVASTHNEEASVEALRRQGEENGAEGLVMLSSSELARREPFVRGTCALFSPGTGIVDSHALIRTLESTALDRGCVILYRTRLTGVDPNPSGYTLSVEGADGRIYTFTSSVVVNAAGLHADEVASMAGIDIDSARYKIHRVKGQYFRVRRSKEHLVRGLVYPAPEAHLIGLGIHATKDLAGSLRLGPDARYTLDLDYDVDQAASAVFLESARRLLPFLADGDIHPDMAGIRPKLQAPGEPFRDFVIRHEADRGLPGLVSLVGIESPGLTSCLAVAELVERLVKDAGLC